MAETALFQIIVGGNDISTAVSDLLESVSATAKAGHTSDTAEIELNDAGARVLLPSKGETVAIALGRSSIGVGPVFLGQVDTVRHKGNRHSGRRLCISAKSFDTNGKAKEPLDFHKDDATLQDFMSEAAQRAGFTMQIAGDLASKQRPYWGATGESFIHLGRRIAREIGATFKIVGKTGIMVPRNGGLSIGGQALTSFVARAGAGGNLQEWDIAPMESRPRYATAAACWFDPAQAKWLKKETGIDIPGMPGEAMHKHRHRRADESEAGDAGESDKRASQREAGSGSAMVLGDPTPQPEGICTVIGTRPGIDGAYRIDAVTHKLVRRQGYDTHLELKQPHSGAGEDDRGGSSGGGDGFNPPGADSRPVG